MRPTITAGAALLALTALTGAAPAPAQTPALRGVSANGTGCPATSATVSLDRATPAFVVTFSAFQTGIGPGTSPADRQKTCLISVTMSTPKDTAIAFTSITTLGTDALATGARQHRKTTYSWADGPSGRPRTTSSKGPRTEKWIGPPDTALPETPCGSQTPTFTMRIDLSTAAGSSSPATDPSTGAVTKVYGTGLRTRTCT